tara:strand:- start:3822 stop:5132 length:1311 start_codon:yes stop_codon:yes gene_type:complete
VDKQKEFKRKLFQQVGYEPHSGQLKLHYPDKQHRFTVAVCGRRFGKSLSSAMEAVYTITQPNKRIWVVAPTYELANKVFREVHKKLVIEMGWKPKRFSERDQYIEFDWGSSIQGKSANNPATLLGESNSLVILDEAAYIDKRVWEQYLRPTLSDQKDSRAIFITTPSGFNWVHELYQRDDPEWYSFNSPSWDNHHAFPEGYQDKDLQEIRRNLSPQVFQQEYGASFTSMGGVVYESFRRDTHVGDFKHDPSKQTFCSMDFGYRQPAVLWFQTYLDTNGLEHINIIDEVVHERNIKTETLARRILQKPYHVTRYYADPAGGQVQSQTGMGDIAQMRNFGIYCRFPRDKVSRSISTGIDHVRSFFENADGIHRIHIDKKCKGLIEDLEAYRYELDKDNRPLKENPLKDGRSDHSMDALRMFFVTHYPIKNMQMKVVSR